MRLFHTGDLFWLARDVVDEDGKFTHVESLQVDGTWRRQGEGDQCDIIACVNMTKCEAHGLD
jgi:hypothetical protein